MWLSYLFTDINMIDIMLRNLTYYTDPKQLKPCLSFDLFTGSSSGLVKIALVSCDPVMLDHVSNTKAQKET